MGITGICYERTLQRETLESCFSACCSGSIWFVRQEFNRFLGLREKEMSNDCQNLHLSDASKAQFFTGIIKNWMIMKNTFSSHLRVFTLAAMMDTKQWSEGEEWGCLIQTPTSQGSYPSAVLLPANTSHLHSALTKCLETNSTLLHWPPHPGWPVTGWPSGTKSLPLFLKMDNLLYPSIYSLETVIPILLAPSINLGLDFAWDHILTGPLSLPYPPPFFPGPLPNHDHLTPHPRLCI